MNNELLPCPFCRGEAELITKYSASLGHVIECSVCGVNTPWEDSEAAAIAVWNGRDGCQEAPTAPQSAL